MTKSKTSTSAKAQEFRLGFLVHDVSRMRRTFFDQAVKPLGITRSQWWLMANLSRHSESGMTQTDLARLMDLGKVTVGGLIDRLEALGHVERLPHPEDRRIKLVHVTPSGFKILDQMQLIGKAVNSEIYANIDKEEIRVAEAVLSQMKNNLRHALTGIPLSSDDED